MKTFLLAIVLSLTCLQVQQVSAAELTAGLILQNFYDPGAIYISWATNTSSATSLDHKDKVPHASGSTSARYGSLRIAWDSEYFGDSTPGGNNSQFIGKADPQASWSDTITISNAALTGTGGHFRPAFRYTGSLHGSSFTDGPPNEKISDSAVSLSVIFNFTAFYDYNELLTANGTLSINADAAAVAASNGVPYLDIPFVFGQPFPISASLTMSTPLLGGGTYVSYVHHTDYAQLEWLHGEVFDAATNLVSYTVTSESGIDWALPQSFAVPALQISGITISDGTNLVINGTGGLLANPVVLLTSTNLALPMVDWGSLSTNYFDFYGGASFTNAINPGEPQRFFRMLSQ